MTCLLVLFATDAQANTEVETTPSPQQVVVNGARTDVEAGRDFVAGKIIVGKQRILDSGVQNVGELLRREPAISIGKDGRLGLLGMPGYTQVLVDGTPYSGDAFALDLVHVEKIEIIKTTTAATGPVGIAGTINILRKKTERQAMTSLRGGVAHAGRLGGNLGWSSNQVVANGPLSYNLSLSASHRPTESSSRYVETRTAPGTAPAFAFDGERAARNGLQTLTATTEFTWMLDAQHKLSFSPDAGVIKVSEDSSEGRRWRDGRSFSGQARNEQTMSSFSLPLRWDWRIDTASTLAVKLNRSHTRIDIDARRTDEAPGVPAYRRSDEQEQVSTNTFLNLDYHTELSGGHDITAGAKLVRNDMDLHYADFIDGQPDLSLAVLGLQAASLMDSWQLFAQDEWRIDRTLALNLGVSGERRSYALEEGLVRNRMRFTMWSPSIHLSKKIGGNSKRQVRVSLARSFQPPDTMKMLLHPSISPFAPCRAGQLCGANSAGSADTSGNPSLQPERALGLNLSYTHGIGKDSELVVEAWSRDIENKIGYDIGLEQVAWASSPRYVYRSANLGGARVRGLNLEGRVSSKDVWKASPDMELHGSLGWAHSELSDVPGPENSLAGQTPWRAKLGGSYTLAAAPIKLGIESSYLPGDWVRSNASERVYESGSLILGASANWKLNAKSRLTVNADKLLARRTTRIDAYQGPLEQLARATSSSNHARLSIRYETRL